MTCGNCATCRHWMPDDCQTGYVGQSVGECALGKSSSGYPDCITLAFAADSEMYAARFYTFPAFGCVQWEKAVTPIGSVELRREIID